LRPCRLHVLAAHALPLEIGPRPIQPGLGPLNAHHRCRLGLLRRPLSRRGDRQRPLRLISVLGAARALASTPLAEAGACATPRRLPTPAPAWPTCARAVAASRSTRGCPAWTRSPSSTRTRATFSEIFGASVTCCRALIEPVISVASCTGAVCGRAAATSVA